jgi:hypothetical protein
LVAVDDEKNDGGTPKKKRVGLTVPVDDSPNDDEVNAVLVGVAPNPSADEGLDVEVDEDDGIPLSSIAGAFTGRFAGETV